MIPISQKVLKLDFIWIIWHESPKSAHFMPDMPDNFFIWHGRWTWTDTLKTPLKALYHASMLNMLDVFKRSFFIGGGDILLNGQNQRIIWHDISPLEIAPCTC